MPRRRKIVSQSEEMIGLTIRLWHGLATAEIFTEYQRKFISIYNWTLSKIFPPVVAIGKWHLHPKEPLLSGEGNGSWYPTIGCVANKGDHIITGGKTEETPFKIIHTINSFNNLAQLYFARRQAQWKAPISTFCEYRRVVCLTRACKIVARNGYANLCWSEISQTDTIWSSETFVICNYAKIAYSLACENSILNFILASDLLIGES